MSERKQEARELKPLNITDDRPDYEWNGEFTQESLDKGVKASAERRRQANQPQKAHSFSEWWNYYSNSVEYHDEHYADHEDIAEAAWTAAFHSMEPLASQPQEKAQPESQQDIDERNAYTGAQENAHKILGKVYSKLYTPVEQAAFQRGQRAMAEKAAQACEANFKGCDKSNVACHKLDAEAIRSLVSAEPPQLYWNYTGKPCSKCGHIHDGADAYCSAEPRS
jgi:hypothetical protein